ncbi:hypothetical protein [Qipengyuania sphaerica]|uniref:hypothetical protein n=1 Tax=Qipengyuania sphaerica TaxID=2867243 RepID=UPI001C88AC5E|nr:hypothetical protein [Qipengyuania sphaerica]MBX7539585.1 hypothetical protein [Qipengyuania sphaerica]
MKYAPHVLGAVAVVTIAGAVSGATIGESPMLQRGQTDTLPQAQIVSASNAAMDSSRRPPDHYPLKTPEGTIEVAELALHGRLRNRGGDMWWEGRSDDRVDLSAGYDFYETASPERIAREERLLAFHGEQPQEQVRHVERQVMTRAEAPMALAEPVELAVAEAAPVAREPEPTSIGNSKTIDVAATLARRD